MPKRLERHIENDCVNIAAAFGVFSIKADKVARSLPDRIFFLPKPAHVWVVEFKQPGEKARAQQRERLATFEALGYDTDVIDSVTVFRAGLLRRLATGPGAA